MQPGKKEQTKANRSMYIVKSTMKHKERKKIRLGTLQIMKETYVNSNIK